MISWGACTVEVYSNLVSVDCTPKDQHLGALTYNSERVQQQLIYVT